MLRKLLAYYLLGGPHVSGLFPSLNITIRTDNKDEFEVGTPRVLACIIVGCATSLNVTWYLGDNMLRPNVYKEVNRGNFTVSSLTFVPSLNDNGKELVCRVTNGDLSQVIEDRVTISVGHKKPGTPHATTENIDHKNMFDAVHPELAPPVLVSTPPSMSAEHSVMLTIGIILALLIAICIFIYWIKCRNGVRNGGNENVQLRHFDRRILANRVHNN